MTSPDILDFDRLLAPIPGDDPAGPDLRRDPSPLSDYTVLKDAHRKARNLERDREAATEIIDLTALLPEWRPVLELAQEVLSEKSKDMEVTAWLIEVLGRAYGFPGLRDGFRLATELVERFWEDLHSVENDNGTPDRAAPLAALNGLGSEGPLLTVIRRIPITDAKGIAPFALWQYQQATRPPVSQDEAMRLQTQADNEAMLERIVECATKSGVRYYCTLIADIEACQERFNQLQAALDTRCDAMDAPPGTYICNALATALDAAKHLARDLPLQTSTADSDAAELVEVKDSDAPETEEVGRVALQSVQGMPTSPVRSREEAFQVLLAIADFFRRYEPHSPISYTLEELVRRGRMSLPELLDELIPDEGARRAYLQTAGIKPPAILE